MFTTKRMTTLVAATGVALGAGTNYVYSAYSPQLGARLNINHTKLNLIGLAGNVGVYSSGPVWGRIVDRRGPRIDLAFATVLLLVGYGGMKHMFDTADGISALTFTLLLMFGYMTGAGGNAGLTAAVNATAKSFPHSLRASATALVLSGFGLSAFFFSSISRLLFHGDTSSFLLVLSLGTSLPMIIGFFFVRAVPPVAPTTSEPDEIVYGHTSDIEATPPTMTREGSRTPLLREQFPHNRTPTTPAIEFIPDALVGVELSPTERSLGHSLNSVQPVKERTLGKPQELNIYGFALWCNAEFWIIFAIVALLSGTGIMYINNVGAMAQALYIGDASNTGGYESYQSTQVSLISLTNCLGRIFIGIISDFTSRTPAFDASPLSFPSLRPIPRSSILILVSSLVLLSQLTAIAIDSVQHLWIGSLLLGLSYGSIFGVCPMLVIEYFGIAHFSENWGFVSLAPMVGGNVFSVAFGKNLDAHSDSSASNEMLAPGAAAECTLGKACYVDSLYLTTIGCILALALSVWISNRDRKRVSDAYEELNTEDSEDE